MDTLTRIKRQLKPLDYFMKEMGALPQLRLNLAKDRIEGLLHGLYQVAWDKVRHDIEIDNWSKAIAKIRRTRKSVGNIKKVIELAADRFDTMLEKYPVEMQYLDNLTEAHQEPVFSEALREISRSLRRMAHDAVQVEGIMAATMHPAKKTQGEERLIRSLRLYAKFEDEYPQFLTPKTPAVDHWFIGQVAEKLERFEENTKTRIRAKEVIIARLFEIMGDFGRSEGSISKELRRQKTQGRPNLHIPSCPEDDQYVDLLP